MAVKYRFTKNFDCPVGERARRAYKAGMEMLIPEAHADAADKASAGERIGNTGASDASKPPGGAASEQGQI